MTKQIINGKMYNTDTAKCVAAWENGKFRNNCWYSGFALYQKKTGEFFIDSNREGDYPSCFGESFNYDKEQTFNYIIPISVDEAKLCVERYCTAETYIKLFGDVEE